MEVYIALNSGIQQPQSIFHVWKKVSGYLSIQGNGQSVLLSNLKTVSSLTLQGLESVEADELTEIDYSLQVTGCNQYEKMKKKNLKRLGRKS